VAATARADRAFRAATQVALIVCVGLLTIVVAYVFSEARFPPSPDGTLAGYLLFDDWHPVGSQPSYGIVHAWVSTLLIVGTALVLATPPAIAIGVFLSEVAPPAVRSVADPALQLLAGIPAVVYGFVGYATLVPFFEQWLPTGETVLTAAIVLAIMMLPFVAATAAESLALVADDLRLSGLALGVSRWSVFSRIALRHAGPGIFAGIILGLARGLGETLAVLMLSGNSPSLPSGWLERGQPLTALIATDLGESAVGSDRYAALFGAGCVLIAGVFAINAGVFALKRRLLRGVAR